MKKHTASKATEAALEAPAHHQASHSVINHTPPAQAQHLQAMAAKPQSSRHPLSHKPYTSKSSTPVPSPKPAIQVVTVKKESPQAAPSFTYQSMMFSTAYLDLQEFSIPCDMDTEIVGKEGMTVSIPAQAFVDASGKLVKGRVVLQVKEAFTASDIVLANLVTKKGKDLLESGGMYYLNAVSDHQSLSVAPGKQLGVEVPSPTKEPGMELYKGLQTDAGLDWTEPLAMAGNAPVAVRTKANIVSETIQKGFVPARQNANREANLFKRKKGGKAKVDSLGWLGENFNTFESDGKVSYLMNTNRMGWANIDRLYHDPRSRQVQFVTTVEKGFEKVYTTMIFKSRRIYLPGYQKADGTYSFTHGDYEEPVLPIGEEAIVMVSAYKNGVHYFSMQPLKIEAVMNVSLVPQLLKEEEIKAQINNSL